MDVANNNYAECEYVACEDQKRKRTDSACEILAHKNVYKKKLQIVLEQDSNSPSTKEAWNSSYQKFEESLLPDELKGPEIEMLHQKFVNLVNKTASRLVVEESLPESQRTLKPIDKGRAGGEKYEHQEIFFKFCRDKAKKIYLDDELVIKAACNEIRAYSEIISLQIPNLHTPLVCLVQYLGRAVLAVSRLPIDSSTLVYGSDSPDPQTKNRKIKNDTQDTTLQDIVEHMAQELFLKKHLVGDGKQELYGPTDIEIHRAMDNLYYVIDVARLFPPLDPSLVTRLEDKTKQAITGKILAFQLRPEFLRKYKVPLNSDAFMTGMTKNDPNRIHHNNEVKTACDYLVQKIIPEFAQKLDTKVGLQPKEFIVMLHKRGINVCLLGYVYSHLKTQEAKELVMTEMLARVVKSAIFRKMREQQIPAGADIEKQFAPVVASELNRILFGNDKKLAEELSIKFHPLKSEIAAFDKSLFLERIQELAAFKIHPDGLRLVDQGCPLTDEIESFGVKVTRITAKKKPNMTHMIKELEQRLEKLKQGKKVKEMIFCMHNLAQAYLHQMDIISAEYYLQRAHEVANDNRQQVLLFFTAAALAQLYLKLDNKPLAEEFRRQVYDLRKSLGNRLNDLGPVERVQLLYYDTNYLESTSSVYERNKVQTWSCIAYGPQAEAADSFIKEIMEPAKRPAFMKKLIGIFADLGKAAFDASIYSQSRNYLLKALQYWEDEKFPVEKTYIDILNYLAGVLRTEGHYDAAIAYSGRARTTLQNTSPETCPDLDRLWAMYHNGYANTLYNLGYNEDAAKEYLQSVEKFTQVNDTNVVRPLLNLGRLEAEENDLQAAAFHTEKALNIIVEQNAGAGLLPWALDYLGVIRILQGRVSEALSMITKAQTLYAEINRETQFWARATKNLARAQIAAGLLEEASKNATDGKECMKRCLGANHMEVGHCMVVLGDLFKAKNNFLQAEMFYKLGLKIFWNVYKELAAQHPYVKNVYRLLDAIQCEDYLPRRMGMDVAARLSVNHITELRSDTPEGIFPGEDGELGFSIPVSERRHFLSISFILPPDFAELLYQDACLATANWKSNFSHPIYYIQEKRHYHLTLRGDIIVPNMPPTQEDLEVVTQQVENILNLFRQTTTEQPILKFTKLTISKASINCEAFGQNFAMVNLYEALKGLNARQVRDLNHQSTSLIRYRLNNLHPSEFEQAQKQLKQHLIDLQDSTKTHFEYNIKCPVEKIHLVWGDRIAQKFEVVHSFTVN